MTPVEILALILAVLVAVKILVILVSPKSWFKIVKSVYSIPVLTMIICVILAGVVLYYLIQALTIVEIFAATLFMVLVAGVTIASYHKELVPAAMKLLKDRKILVKAILPLLIWVALVVWVLYSLFA